MGVCWKNPAQLVKDSDSHLEYKKEDRHYSIYYEKTRNSLLHSTGCYTMSYCMYMNAFDTKQHTPAATAAAHADCFQSVKTLSVLVTPYLFQIEQRFMGKVLLLIDKLE